jgi:hypothetical protein
VTSTAKKIKKPQEVGIIARSEGLKGVIQYAKDQGYKNPQAWAIRQMKVRGLNIK